MEDRSNYYKNPMKFGAQTLYQSEVLKGVSLKHWEAFDKKVRSGENFKAGDFIDNAVNVTAIQRVEFLDKFMNFKTVDEVKAECEKYIEEIQKEVNLGTTVL